MRIKAIHRCWAELSMCHFGGWNVNTCRFFYWQQKEHEKKRAKHQRWHSRKLGMSLIHNWFSRATQKRKHSKLYAGRELSGVYIDWNKKKVNPRVNRLLTSKKFTWAGKHKQAFSQRFVCRNEDCVGSCLRCILDLLLNVGGMELQGKHSF